MFKIRTSKYRHVFCDQPKPEVRKSIWILSKKLLDSWSTATFQVVLSHTKVSYASGLDVNMHFATLTWSYSKSIRRLVASSPLTTFVLPNLFFVFLSSSVSKTFVCRP